MQRGAARLELAVAEGIYLCGELAVDARGARKWCKERRQAWRKASWAQCAWRGTLVALQGPRRAKAWYLRQPEWRQQALLAGVKAGLACVAVAQTLVLVEELLGIDD